MTKKRATFLIFLIVSLILFFPKLPTMASYGADQEFYAYQYIRIVKEHRPTLLGSQASVGELFIAPLYTYLAI